MIIIQLTGLSGAGKTTIATLTKEKLTLLGVKTEIIDGDVYRETLCKDLGFSEDDRKENIRRLAGVAHNFALQGVVSIISAISPFETIRKELTLNYQAKTVWVKCSLDLLIQRDTKGLYRKALLPIGNPERIENFTGISQQYDIPEKPDLIVNTDLEPEEESAKKLTEFILTQLNLLNNLNIPIPLELTL